MTTFSLPLPTSSRPRTGSLRVAILLVVLLILNLIDLHYTLFAHRVGLLNEVNPIAASLLHLNLIPSLICFKALTLLVGFSLLWRFRHARLTPAACWFLIAVYVALSITWYFWTQNFIEIQQYQSILAQPNPALGHL